MVGQLFRKVAGLAKNTPHPMPDAAVVAFDSYCMLFAGIMAIRIENFDKRLPIVCGYAAICNAELFELFAQAVRASVAPYIGDDFAAFAVVRVNQPFSISF